MVLINETSSSLRARTAIDLIQRSEDYEVAEVLLELVDEGSTWHSKEEFTTFFKEASMSLARTSLLKIREETSEIFGVKCSPAQNAFFELWQVARKTCIASEFNQLVCIGEWVINGKTELDPEFRLPYSTLIPCSELFEDGLAEYFAHGFKEYDDAMKEYIECYIDCLKLELTSGKIWDARIGELLMLNCPDLIRYIFAQEEQDSEIYFGEAWYYAFIRAIVSNVATPQETKDAIREILESERAIGFASFDYEWSEEQVEECIRLCE